MVIQKQRDIFPKLTKSDYQNFQNYSDHLLPNQRIYLEAISFMQSSHQRKTLKCLLSEKSSYKIYDWKL